jgi:hypothetical protein
MSGPGEQLTMSAEQAQMYAERGRKLTEIRKLHRPGPAGYCFECDRRYPCRTAEIIESRPS